MVARGSEEERLAAGLDPARLPRHVAVIMDGNGRWAKGRFLPRVAGHRAGVQSVRETIEGSARLGIEVLTLYAFSKENWKRPRAEVDTLMGLLREYLRRERQALRDNNIRLKVIGRLDDLPASVRAEVTEAVEYLSENDGMQLNIALSYGGRAELVDACRRMLAEGIDPASVDEDTVDRYLYTAGCPDPDLLIRTSGEMRISNFLLWQIAYSEIWITDTLWPDFKLRHLLEAITAYQGRERRFGGTSSSRSEQSAAAARG
ncbi:UDP pyrophosphate synthase [Acidobacteria bacterium Mor1]|nr:UDP pyrophosphate synthase [Acidobacteria bacterium Mor1]